MLRDAEVGRVKDGEIGRVAEILAQNLANGIECRPVVMAYETWHVLKKECGRLLDLENVGYIKEKSASLILYGPNCLYT